MKKLSAKQFRYALADIAAALQQQIEADCEGFPSDPKASTKRRNRRLPTLSFPAHVLPALLHDPRRQHVAYMA